MAKKSKNKKTEDYAASLAKSLNELMDVNTIQNRIIRDIHEVVQSKKSFEQIIKEIKNILK